MSIEKKAQEARAEARHVQAQMEDTFLASIKTELTLIQTYCRLAQEEDGQERAHHVELAETALKSILRMAKHVELNQEQRSEIEGAGRNIRELGGRDLSQQES